LIHQLAIAAALDPGRNILIDLRDTTLTIENTGHLLDCATEFARYEHSLRHKIANVIPHDEASIAIAKALESLMDAESFKYQVFTKLEDAINWLTI
jgi:hypothetical protein